VAHAPGEITSMLLDLADLDLADLPELDQPVLASALSGIRDTVENPDDAVAGFNSSI
jgi:FXSXX-COOH protein